VLCVVYPPSWFETALAGLLTMRAGRCALRHACSQAPVVPWSSCSRRVILRAGWASWFETALQASSPWGLIVLPRRTPCRRRLC